MKSNKATKAPHILLMTKRFNDVSRLVASDIIRRSTASDRAAIIEKWAEVANAAATLHNYNGVLQICSAFSNSAVFRLKKTWEKVSKTVSNELRQVIFSCNYCFYLLMEFIDFSIWLV